MPIIIVIIISGGSYFFALEKTHVVSLSKIALAIGYSTVCAL